MSLVEELLQPKRHKYGSDRELLDELYATADEKLRQELDCLGTGEARVGYVEPIARVRFVLGRLRKLMHECVEA